MRQKDNASKSHVVLIGTYTEPQGSDSEAFMYIGWIHLPANFPTKQ